jgi:hypothetical protein
MQISAMDEAAVPIPTGVHVMLDILVVHVSTMCVMVLVVTTRSMCAVVTAAAAVPVCAPAHLALLQAIGLAVTVHPVLPTTMAHPARDTVWRRAHAVDTAAVTPTAMMPLRPVYATMAGQAAAAVFLHAIISLPRTVVYAMVMVPAALRIPATATQAQ